MAKDKFYYRMLEEKCEKKIAELNLSLSGFSLKKVENKADLEKFVSFISEVSSYLAYLNVFFKIRHSTGKGLEGSLVKNATKYLDETQNLFNSFVDKDPTHLLPERGADNEFMDEIKEMDKINLFQNFITSAEIFMSNIENVRLFPAFTRIQVYLVNSFKNWFNFRLIFQILDDPSHEDHIQTSSFLKLFFKNLFSLAESCHRAFELSQQKDTKILLDGINFLLFLIKIENIRRGEFFEDASRLKKTAEIWQKRLDNAA